MSYYDGGSFSGQSYDRHIFEANLSTVNKMQREYWTAKQVLRKKFGKSEDQHVVASDTEIDSKLGLFESIQRTCVDLLKELEKYQACICALARDENQLGRFLKDQGAQDKTQAGKMMAAVGKSLCYSAQQRLLLRHPLGRLHQDIETFRYRAIADTIMSIDKMEEERTHYRASLLWMQDISSNLDPEQYKKLEKFRKVQKEVRLNKEKFDQLKWAVCQKIDLLSASRSNLFSNTLVPYQDELLKFWEKTARTMSAVLESFKGYQHYQFKLLKELDSAANGEMEKEERGGKDSSDDALICLDENERKQEQASEDVSENLFQDAMDSLNLNSPERNKETDKAKKEPEDKDLLGDFGDNAGASKEDMDLLNDILGDGEQEGTSEFANQWKTVFGDFESAPSPARPASVGDVLGAGQPQESLDPLAAAEATNPVPQQMPGPQNHGYLPSQLMDMHFGNFATGNQGMMQAVNMPHSMMMAQTNPQQMMMMSHQNMVPTPPAYSALFGSNQQMQQPLTNPGAMSDQSRKDSSQYKGNKAAWYNLFAELDPLQNPDSLGKKEGGKNQKQDGGAC